MIFLKICVCEKTSNLLSLSLSHSFSLIHTTSSSLFLSLFLSLSASLIFPFVSLSLVEWLTRIFLEENQHGREDGPQRTQIWLLPMPTNPLLAHALSQGGLLVQDNLVSPPLLCASHSYSLRPLHRPLSFCFVLKQWSKTHEYKEWEKMRKRKEKEWERKRERERPLRVRSRSSSTAKWERPKSVSFRCPSPLNNKFSGFKSRWIMWSNISLLVFFSFSPSLSFILSFFLLSLSLSLSFSFSHTKDILEWRYSSANTISAA